MMPRRYVWKLMYNQVQYGESEMPTKQTEDTDHADFYLVCHINSIREDQPYKKTHAVSFDNQNKTLCDLDITDRWEFLNRLSYFHKEKVSCRKCLNKINQQINKMGIDA